MAISRLVAKQILVHTHSGILFIHEDLIPATIWVDPENIMLIEKSQT